jgi:hypothetical protein
MNPILIKALTHSLNSLDPSDRIEKRPNGYPLRVLPAQPLHIADRPTAIPDPRANHDDGGDREGRSRAERLPRILTGIETWDKVARSRIEADCQPCLPVAKTNEKKLT